MLILLNSPSNIGDSGHSESLLGDDGTMLDKDLLRVYQKVINHPAHIVDKYGKVLPSAFIPFCEFGLDKSKIGIKIDLFDDFICNAFEPKIHDDQLCYEVDLNRYKDENNLESQLKDGLSFVLDFNKERQWVTFNETEEEAFIYLDTIGLYITRKGCCPRIGEGSAVVNGTVGGVQKLLRGM